MRTKTTELETKLDAEMLSAMDQLDGRPADTDQYAAIVDQVVKMHKLRMETSSRVSKDTLAIIAANLVGILVIVGHEHTGIIASKAMNLVLKPR